MNQSALIIGGIIFLFFVYITVKGELPVYAGLLLLAPGGTTSSGTPATQTQQSSNAIVSGALGALAGL